MTKFGILMHLIKFSDKFKNSQCWPNHSRHKDRDFIHIASNDLRTNWSRMTKCGIWIHRKIILNLLEICLYWPICQETEVKMDDSIYTLKAITWSIMIKNGVYMYLKMIFDSFENSLYWPLFKGWNGWFYIHCKKILENKMM